MSSKLINLEGNVYGRLTVLSLNVIDRRGAKWNCLCSCGNKGIVRSGNLRKRIRPTVSCGCLKIEKAGTQVKTHGLTKTRIHTIWLNMKSRCYNHKNLSYCDYGAKGVIVCERWFDFKSFYKDVKEGYKEHLTLDRYPNKNGNYEPNNFRWATQLEQQRNRRNNRLLTIKGKSATSMEWSEITGVPFTTIKNRVNRKWSDYECVYGRQKNTGSINKITLWQK